MDFTDLLNSIKEAIRPGSTAVRDLRTGITYGPAQSRYTRTDQQFINNPKDNMSGQYFPAARAPLGHLLPESWTAHPVEKINIGSPDNTDTPTTIRHEDTHALLDSLTDEQYQAMGENNPAMRPIVNKLEQAGRYGWAGAEVPAYMTERNPQLYGIDPALRAQYLGHIVKQLGSINPSLVPTYKKLAGME